MGCHSEGWQGARVFPKQHPGMGRRERQLCITKSQLLPRTGKRQQRDGLVFSVIPFNEMGRAGKEAERDSGEEF